MARGKREPTPDREVERFVVEDAHRSALSGADYNPRILSDKARRKLQSGIEKLGLLSPIVANRRTGRVVSGHQRLSIIDSLKGTKDYRLQVAWVDLDESQEKAANLLMNNAEAQGEWDLEKLESMFRDNLDLDATGFDVADVYRLFGDSPLTEHGTEQIDELSAKLREARERYDKVANTSSNRDSTDFYVVVVFKDYDDRMAFLDALKLDDNRFQDGRELRRLFGLAQAGEEPVQGD